jgi:hypothetical protein
MSTFRKSEFSNVVSVSFAEFSSLEERKLGTKFPNAIRMVGMMWKEPSSILPGSFHLIQQIGPDVNDQVAYNLVVED